MSRDFGMDEDFGEYDYPYGQNKKHPFLFISVILLVLIVVAYVFVQSTYLDLTDDIRVAKVQAIKADVPDQMNVTLTLYNKEGQRTSVDSFAVHSNKWILQASSIRLNLFFAQLSKYHLTHFGGLDKSNQLNRPTFTRGTSSVLDAEGNFSDGGDSIFNMMRNFPLPTSVNTQVYASAGPQPNGTTYNVFMSSQGNLYIKASD
jgi:hypothetical protein